MGLYNRGYSNKRSYESVKSYASDTELVSFVKTTYKIFAVSLLIATIGSLFGLQNAQIVISNKWIVFIVEIAAFFGLMFLHRKPVVNILLLGVFTFFSGLTLVPLLYFVISSQGIGVVVQAFAMTTSIFAIMSVYGIKTRRDLSGMGKILFIAVLVMFVFALLNVFFFHSPMLQFGIACISVVVFTLLIAYDTQNILKGLYESPLIAAISLYLNFVNLFSSLLQIFGILGSSRD